MHFSLLAGLAGLLSLSTASPVPELFERQTCSDTGISSARAQQVRSAFSSARITPNVIPAFDPKVEVRVSYNGKAVNLGNSFSTLETATAPTITFSAESDQNPSTTKYTIIFFDPDAPGPNSNGNPALLANFLHLLVIDASPQCINPSNNGGGSTLAMYKPLTPLSVSSHRYIQVVHRQTRPVSRALALSYLTGAFFDVNGFVNNNGLVAVGGNYFRQGLGTVVPRDE